MKCMNDQCGNELIGRQKTYCSDKCRMTQSRTDKSNKPNPNTKPEQVIIDACGKAHPIDLEGRRRDYELLESWARGEGNEYQRRLGQLARHYEPDESGLDTPKRNAQTRARLRATPLEELKANKVWTPVWREVA